MTALWPRKPRHSDGKGGHADGRSNGLYRRDQASDNDVFALVLGHESKPEGSASKSIDFRKGSNVDIRHAYRVREAKNRHVLSLLPLLSTAVVGDIRKHATEWCDEGKSRVHHVSTRILPGPRLLAVSGGRPSIPRGDARGAQKCVGVLTSAGRAAVSRGSFATIASSRHQFEDRANP